MEAPLRGQGNPVSAAELLATMADAPWKHDFLQALRTLEASFANKPRFGTARKPADEMVRLAQAPELSFAPSTLSAVYLADAQGPPRIEVRFFGLFGPNGPLPSHLTEYARERLLHHSDPTFARFAVIFHHRLLLLFYRAWAQAQPTANLDRPNDDRFGHQVGSLIGLGTPLHRNRDAAPDHAKLFFSGYLARQARHSDGLRSMLSAYLRMPVTVESFVGQWLELPANERTQIGRAGSGSRTPTSKLGAGAVLGRRVFGNRSLHRLQKPLRRNALQVGAARRVLVDQLIAMLGRVLHDVVVLAVVNHVHVGSSVCTASCGASTRCLEWLNAIAMPAVKWWAQNAFPASRGIHQVTKEKRGIVSRRRRGACSATPLTQRDARQDE